MREDLGSEQGFCLSRILMCTFTACGDAVEVLSLARMMETKVHIHLKKLP